MPFHATADGVLKQYFADEPLHPGPVRCTLEVLSFRLGRIPLQARRPLLVETVKLFGLAEHLKGNADAGWVEALRRHQMDIASGGQVPAWLDFPDSQFICRVQTWSTESGSWPLRTFLVYRAESNDAHGFLAEDQWVARIAVIQHIRFFWEVMDVEVRPEFRRRGIATGLYDCVDKFCGGLKLDPSGWLTADALAFWSKRKPGVEAFFTPHPLCSDLFISPRQVKYRKHAMEARMLQFAKRPEGGRLS